MFLNTFFCADELSMLINPTDVGNINSITIANGIYDDLYATEDVEAPLNGVIPSEWDNRTILHATFEKNLNAGNVDWTVETVDYIVIKRKRDNDNKWITLYVKPINDPADFEIDEQDITPTVANYQYAAVPVLQGVEGVYSIAKTVITDENWKETEVYDYTPVRVDELTILDNDAIYSTIVTDGSLSTTSNTATSYITTLNEKYPTTIRNSRFNYETIQVSGTFLPKEEDGCELIIDDPVKMALYNRELKAWLTSNRPKILKNPDGNIWLVYIDSGLTDSPYDRLPELRELSFTCTEIGNVENEEDLWNANILNATVSPEWWNS